MGKGKFHQIGHAISHPKHSVKGLGKDFKKASVNVGSAFAGLPAKVQRGYRMDQHAFRIGTRAISHSVMNRKQRKFSNRQIFGRASRYPKKADKWMRKSKFARQSGLATVTRTADALGLNPMLMTVGATDAIRGKKGFLTAGLQAIPEVGYALTALKYGKEGARYVPGIASKIGKQTKKMGKIGVAHGKGLLKGVTDSSKSLTDPVLPKSEPVVGNMSKITPETLSIQKNKLKSFRKTIGKRQRCDPNDPRCFLYGIRNRKRKITQ